MSARSELPNDPALPHLACAIDEAAMCLVFAQGLDAQGLQVEHCRLERIKYRPRRNGTLSYNLSLRDAATNTVFEQRVAARLCSGGESRQRAINAAQSNRLPTRAGPAVQHLPALDMVTWWWPNDPKLAAPRVLSNQRLLREQVLPQVVAALSDGRGTLTGYDMAIAQYVPEHRVSARVDVQWQADGKARSQHVYAKASREPDAATAHGFLRALQGSDAWRSGQLRTPRALIMQPQFDLHWQQALPGVALLDVDAATMTRFAAPLGAQLAALHRTAVATTRELTAATLRARLTEVTGVLAAVLPAARGPLRHAAHGLGAGLHALHDLPAATLHGDLHARNILVDGDTLALIDLDGLRRGPAVLELGAWRADGLYRALLDHVSPARDSAAWQALIEGYAKSGGRVPRPHELAWATAWHLLCQRAWRCVVNLKPGRFAIVQHLIEHACELAGARSVEAA